MPLEKSESNETHEDEVFLDDDPCEKWSVPKRTDVTRSNCDKNFEIIDNDKYGTSFEAFEEDEEIEDESADIFGVIDNKFRS